MIYPGKSVVYCNSNCFAPVSRHFAARPMRSPISPFRFPVHSTNHPVHRPNADPLFSLFPRIRCSTFPVRPRLTLRVRRFYALRPSFSIPFLVFFSFVIRLLFSFTRLHSRLFGFIHFRHIKRPLAGFAVNAALASPPRASMLARRARSQIHMQFPRFSVLVMMNLATISVDLDISADIAQSAQPFLCFWFRPATLFPASAATLQDFEGLSKERSRTILPL